MGYVCVQRDITPIKEAERLKDEFVSNVSHELRTPLSIITLIGGNLDRLYDRLDDDRRRKMIRDIRDQAEVLNDLVRDILEISRIESGRVSMERAPVDLGHLVRRRGGQADAAGPEEAPDLARRVHHGPVGLGQRQPVAPGDPQSVEQRHQVHARAGAASSASAGCWRWGTPPTPNGRARDELARRSLGGDARGRHRHRHQPRRTCRACTSASIGSKPRATCRVQAWACPSSASWCELHGGHIAAASSVGAGSTFAVYLPLLEE